MYTAGSASDPNPKHERIEMIVYAVLIEHPTAGLILYETGCHDEMEKYWGPVRHHLGLWSLTGTNSNITQMYDVSPRKQYTVKNRLDKQIEACGHSIKDVKAVIMGHLRKFPICLSVLAVWHLIESRCWSLWWVDALYRYRRSNLCPWSWTFKWTMVSLHQGMSDNNLRTWPYAHMVWGWCRPLSTFISWPPSQLANIQR